MLRIGINGFGRIGRAIFRNNLSLKLFDVVAINDINPDQGNIAYTLNYDTLYDRLPFIYKPEDGYLTGSNGDKIKLLHHNSIKDVDWKAYNLDFIIDASGVFQNVLDAQEVIKSGAAKKVFVTHSPEPVDFTMVLGANETELDINKHHVISTSICDATALAPVLKALSVNFGIQYGSITTLHPWLSYQNLMDGPASSWSVPGEIYHHYALGRSVVGNMIPKPTSAITAACKVLGTENITEDMIGSFSYRTPTSIVGSADITLLLKNKCTKEDVIAIFERLESTQQWNIIHNNWEPLVSLDFKKFPYAAIIDHRWTDVVKDNMLKLVLWYDNEYGYASKVIDQIKFVADKMNLPK